MDEIIKRLEDKLDERFNRMEEKHDELSKDVSDINITLVKQEAQLAEHIRRSAAAEDNLALLRSEFKPVQVTVQRQQFLWSVIGKIGAAIAAGTGMIVGLIEIIKHFKN